MGMIDDWNWWRVGAEFRAFHSHPSCTEGASVRRKQPSSSLEYRQNTRNRTGRTKCKGGILPTRLLFTCIHLLSAGAMIFGMAVGVD